MYQTHLKMRSKWKGPIITHSLMKKVVLKKGSIFENDKYDLKPFYIYQRSLTILPKYLDLTFYIYHGCFKIKRKRKVLNELEIESIHFAHKAGEFFKTRKDHHYRSKKRKKNKPKK